MKTITISTTRSLAAITLSGTLLWSCGFQTYSPQPIDPVANAAHYQAHDPNSEDFRQYLLAQGYPASELPIKQWGPKELTLSALFFHPELDVARAQWRAAQASELTSGERQNPGISGNLENHSRTDGGISPWTYGLGIDIPIETGGKRQARIDRAQSLSEAARIEIAQTAWQVRSRLLASLIDYNALLQQSQLLQQETDLRSEIAAMMDARLDAGMVSSIEVGNSRLQLQKVQQALLSEKGREPELRAVLASNAGLPLPRFERLPLQAINIKFDKPQEKDEFRGVALLNRLDIRAALARYDAAEAKLRLEIARQYPDIVLSPGYAYDQGDRIWSLGISALLTLLNKNEGLIAEAQALREVEAAQFEMLQAKLISDLEQSIAAYDAAMEQLEKTRQLETAQLDRFQRVQRQFDEGITDRLELATARLENLVARQATLNSEHKSQRAGLALENALQRPLDNESSAFIDFTAAVSPEPQQAH